MKILDEILKHVVCTIAEIVAMYGVPYFISKTFGLGFDIFACSMVWLSADAIFYIFREAIKEKKNENRR